jgi:hypothetical protein
MVLWGELPEAGIQPCFREGPMSLLGFPIYDALNESDVEQKFIYPLLTHESFLAIPSRAILTKKSLGSMSFVDKSALPRGYVPDYVIFFSGYPVCVIEAKSPDVAAGQAISEARLYSQLLNENFPSGKNPVLIAVGCNGRDLLVSSWDSNAAERFSCAELQVGTARLARLRELMGTLPLNDHAIRIHRAISRVSFTTPARDLGSQMFVERVSPNALAPYLNTLYEMFFRSEDPEKIRLILERAYVDTAELREYDQVLHVLLRQIERTHNSYQTIQTDREREYNLTPEINRYQSDIGDHGRMHLIIGSRGSGKSLFIARFFSYLIPDDLRRQAAWCVLDFNRAPSNIDNIEDYICETFVETVQNVGFDLYTVEGLNRVFSVELNRLRRGPLALMLDEGDRQRAEANELIKLSANRRIFALKLARHLTGDANRPLIVAFDNVDRRESEQQLNIFQAAQWFRSETRAFALLTLRDTTFEQYKSVPPLDAFAQLNNFYIRPPRFSLVLQKRLSLAIDEGLKEIEIIEQPSNTGLRFLYTKEQLGDFLRTVYSALFDGDRQVGRIVDALAERDVREALGMFARILASGHFNADQIIGIGVGGRPRISDDLLIKILMRSDYRMFSNRSGFIHNLFRVPRENFSGNVFLTPEVLGFFAQEEAVGIDSVSGYWRLEELISDLSSMGFEELEIRGAVQSAIECKLLAFEGEDQGTPEDEDLLKITPSGFIHLRALPHFIEYVSSIALYCVIRDGAVNRRIVDIWRRAARFPDLGFPEKHDVAGVLGNYLVREKSRLDAENPIFHERCREAEDLVRAITHTVNVTQRVVERIRTRRREATGGTGQGNRA